MKQIDSYFGNLSHLLSQIMDFNNRIPYLHHGQRNIKLHARNLFIKYLKHNIGVKALKCPKSEAADKSHKLIQCSQKMSQLLFHLSRFSLQMSPIKRKLIELSYKTFIWILCKTTTSRLVRQ